jgi:hypothetical protein
MKPTTLRRYQRIRRAFNQLAGTMPIMQIYAALAEQFGYSDESIRKILHTYHPP